MVIFFPHSPCSPASGVNAVIGVLPSAEVAEVAHKRPTWRMVPGDSDESLALEVALTEFRCVW